MNLDQVYDTLVKKHKGNINFNFRMTHGKLEAKNNNEPSNVIIVDVNGKVDITKWYSGSNVNGPFIPPTYANNPSLSNVEHIIDRLLTIPGSNIGKWSF